MCVLLGILGLVLLMKGQQKKPSEIMLAHLTICNILTVCQLVATVVISNFIRAVNTVKTMWILSATQFLIHVPLVVTLIIITVDRILAINLVLKYRLVVTNKRLALVLFCAWLLGVLYGGSTYFVQSMVYFFVSLSASAAVVLFLIVSYLYIIIKVRVMRRGISSTGQSNRHSRFNYTIPLTITLTYILFAVVPDITLQFSGSMNVSPWHYIAWTLNSLADTLTYIIGSPRIRSRLKRGRGSSNRMQSSSVRGSVQGKENEGRNVEMAVVQNR